MGFFLNILLDPWFIKGGFALPAMGIAGIGLATALIQISGAIYLGVMAFRSPLFKTPSPQKNIWALVKPDLKMLKQIINQGLPPALDLSTVSVGGFILIYFINQFGEPAVAAYGIASRIDQLVWLPLIGLDIATLSLVAQNNGARQFDRIWLTLNLSIRYGLILMLILGALVVIFAAQLTSLFSQEPEIIRIGTTIIRISALSYLALPFSFIGFAALRGIKRPILPMLLSIARMIVLPAVIIYLVLTFWNGGLSSIWWTVSGVKIFISFIAWLIVLKMMPQATLTKKGA